MDKIHEYLIDIGVKASNKGFDYLHDAIEAVIEDNERKNKTIEVYKIVGEKHGEKYTAVEHCIRTAVKSIFSNGDKTKLAKVFGDSFVKAGKIANSDFIAISALYLKGAKK